MSAVTETLDRAAPDASPFAPAPSGALAHAAPGADGGYALVRWELMLPAGSPVPANLGGFYEAFGTDDDGRTTLWVLLPVPGDRPGYDPALPAPGYVVDNFLAPVPPFRAGEVDGPRRVRFRTDADGDLVKVMDESWDPEADPVFGPALRAMRGEA